MSPRVLKASSKISTHRRCDNCGTTIDQVAWKQCRICSVFDLCTACAKFDYGSLLSEPRARHEQFHREISEDEPVTADCLESLLVEEAEGYGNEARREIRQSIVDRIRQGNEIQNDHEMFLVMNELKKLGTSTTIEQLGLDQLNSSIARYQLQASQRDIRVLSLDGGGKILQSKINVFVLLLFCRCSWLHAHQNSC
jgi:hypothetical protein